ncbi:hypothetical protein P0F10_003533 [Vibrio metschnikovii]|uniref:HEPN domain-containing protein n=2 Tax=Unclassified Bacteria TaxID=49928 RepID=A0AAU6V035_UNCXX|nr:hypothetical protein [Vibrio metschnikovii]
MTEKDSIFDSIQSYRSQFTILLRHALVEGLRCVDDTIQSSKYIGNHYKWATLSYSSNSLPSFSESLFNGAKDYTSCFGKDRDFLESEILSFNELLRFIKSNGDLESRFLIPEWKGSPDPELMNMTDTFIYSMIKNLIDRYIHFNGSVNFEESLADVLVDEVANYVFLKTLPIDIVVPILFINFNFEEVKLSNNIIIRRMTDEEQLSRNTIKSYNISIHDKVMHSATHALVLTNWEVNNSEHFPNFDILNNPRAYPTELIDKFFASLRIVNDFYTGYAQIFSLAKQWQSHAKANLPYATGVSVRSYPSILENYYWNIEDVPTLSESEALEVGSIFNKLCEVTENSIELSVKRLNQCLVRDSEEDSVLDATIALEALLAGDGNQGITHKLAMRVAGLSKISNNFSKTPKEAFKDIRSIYDYRSAIVHGSKQIDKKRLVRIDESKSITTHSLAVEYLRAIIKTLLELPKYRDVQVIDSELLLGDTDA